MRGTFSLLVALLIQCKLASDGEPERSQPAAAESQDAGLTSSPAVSERDLPPGWIRFAPDGAGFSVAMPNEPTALDTAGSVLYAARRESGSAYSVQCSEHAEGTSKDDVEQMLAGTRSGLIGGRPVLSDSAIDDGRGTGFRIAVELDTDKGQTVVTNLVLLKSDRICTFATYIPSDQDEKADIETFFGSVLLSP